MPAPPDTATTDPTHRRLVLLVEDEIELLAEISAFLRRRGHDVRTASNFDEALEQLKDCAHRLDLLLTDVRLPGGSGLDLLRSAGAGGPNALRRVAMTGHLDQEGIDQAQASGAEHVLLKPFSLSELNRAIQAGAPRRDIAGKDP
ncbi:MAG: response regulator [Alphaproteobacteria bacterium]|nr:response regulator [Alphaproteobacteria bacterium]